jgi:hypothetical protein
MKKRTTKYTPIPGGRGARLFFCTLFLTLIYTTTFPQSLKYNEIFGSDWEKALSFEKENRDWMKPILERNNVPYDIAIAVVFPELVRYSALRDKMEITLLKALYINLGEQYANFSIGQFQVKPTFAEFIRKEGPSVLGRRSGISFPQPDEFESVSEYRKSIVIDLEKPETEFNYIVAFYKLCEKRFRINRLDTYDKVKFTATAYNFGINREADEIRNMIDKKYFNTKLFKTQNYSYSDVALFWYENYRTGIIDASR